MYKRQPVIHTTLTNSYYKGFETLCRALVLLRRAGTEVRAQVAGLTTTDSVYRITRRMMGREFPAGQLDMLGSVAAAANVEHMRRAGIYVCLLYTSGGTGLSASRMSSHAPAQ